MHLSSSQWPTICAKDFSDSWNITWSNELWLYYAERNQFLWPLILISKSTSEEALGTELPSRANFTKDSQRISSFYPCRCHLPAWMSGCSFLQRSLLCLPLLHWHQPQHFWWPAVPITCHTPDLCTEGYHIKNKRRKMGKVGETLILGLGLLIYHQKCIQEDARFWHLLEICFCVRQEKCSLCTTLLHSFRFI